MSDYPESITTKGLSVCVCICVMAIIVGTILIIPHASSRPSLKIGYLLIYMCWRRHINRLCKFLIYLFMCQCRGKVV